MEELLVVIYPKTTTLISRYRLNNNLLLVKVISIIQVALIWGAWVVVIIMVGRSKQQQSHLVFRSMSVANMLLNLLKKTSLRERHLRQISRMQGENRGQLMTRMGTIWRLGIRNDLIRALEIISSLDKALSEIIRVQIRDLQPF